jgi:hypothetical protein
VNNERYVHCTEAGIEGLSNHIIMMQVLPDLHDQTTF